MRFLHTHQPTTPGDFPQTFQAACVKFDSNPRFQQKAAEKSRAMDKQLQEFMARGNQYGGPLTDTNETPEDKVIVERV